MIIIISPHTHTPDRADHEWLQTLNRLKRVRILSEMEENGEVEVDQRNLGGFSISHRGTVNRISFPSQLVERE